MWHDYRNGGTWDIYLYNFTTGLETRINTDPGNQEKPSISGNKIVWEDDRNGNWDIFAFTPISYCQDFLEPGNPGGRTTGLKTWDAVNPEMVHPGDTLPLTSGLPTCRRRI